MSDPEDLMAQLRVKLLEAEGLVEQLKPERAKVDFRAVPPDLRPVREVIYRHCLLVLQYCGGNRKRAGEILGLERKTLSNYLRRGYLVRKKSAQKVPA